MPIQHIVAPVDFSPASRRAFDAAMELAVATGAKIDLVHAIEVLTYRGVQYQEVLKTGTMEDERTRATEELEEWADIARQKNVDITCKILDGDSRGAIVDHASHVKADVIVIGAKGHSRLHDILVGSVAMSVMHAAHCSVYLVR